MTGEAEREHIEARDVRPGDVIWNPYGGARGHAEVASEARERPDGTIEFDCADGPDRAFPAPVPPAAQPGGDGAQGR
jgi:hypothetical protein